MAEPLFFLELLFVIVLCFERRTVIEATSQTIQHATVGDRISFQCSTKETIPPVTWKHGYIGSINPHDVYKNGQLQNGYADNGRYSVDISRNSELIIDNVQTHDAGDYICIDGNGEQSRVKLEVGDGLLDLAIAPQDTLSIVGQDQVILACTSTYKDDVWWKHTPVGADKVNDVYLGSIGFKNGYFSGRRFSIARNDETGQYDLVIRNVQSSDAGTYVCIDQSGIGRKAQAELIVLDSAPICQSNIRSFISSGVLAENSCGLTPDQVQMACSVKYKGNRYPKLEWANNQSDFTDKTHYNTHLHTSDSAVNSSLTVKPVRTLSENTWKSYVCHASINNNNNNNISITYNTLFSCTPNDIEVDTIFVSNWTVLNTVQNTEVKSLTCSINTLDTCKYSWLKEDDGVVVDGQMLNVTTAGKYLCKAECKIRGTPCTVYPMYVDFQTVGKNEENATIWKSWHVAVSSIVTAVVLFSLFIAGSFVWVLVWKKRYQRKSDNKFFQLFKNHTKQKLKSLTLFQEKLYVICNNCNKIYIFSDKRPFNQIDVIKVPGMKGPQDIVSCARNNCLYVRDAASQCIWKIIPNDSQASCNPVVSNIDTKSAFSVTSNGEILIVGGNDNMISRYDSNGKSMDRIELNNIENNSIKNVYMTDDSNYLASFGCRIGLFGKDGRLVCAYPPAKNPVNPTNHADVPWYFLLSKSQNIFVADQENGKVNIFNSILQFRFDINLNERDIQKVCYNESKNELLVGVQSGISVISFIAELTVRPTEDQAHVDKNSNSVSDESTVRSPEAQPLLNNSSSLSIDSVPA